MEKGTAELKSWSRNMTASVMCRGGERLVSEDEREKSGGDKGNRGLTASETLI